MRNKVSEAHLTFGDVTAHEMLCSVRGDCSNSLSTENQTSLCLMNGGKPLAWSDAYSQCLTKATPEVLIEITSMKQWKALKTAAHDQKSLIWLGANNFASCKSTVNLSRVSYVTEDALFCSNGALETFF